MSVLSFEKAYATVADYCRELSPTQPESVDLSQALNRVLAEPIFADRDFPPFPRSTRDGYAVCCADLKTIPARLRVIGQVKAGGRFEGAVSSGQAVEIMTGAPAPAGSDAVVMIEYTKSYDGHIEILRPVASGENIVAQGSEARKGEELVSRGVRIGAAQIAVAAGAGKSALMVHRKPRVGILATGDELVEIDCSPSVYQIRNSNSYSLAAQVTAGGGIPVLLPIAPDDKPALRNLMLEGLAMDMLLLSGGVSMGQFDLVEQVISELGADFFFTGVEIQPGKPVVFGQARSQPFFGLPGNPISTMVTFDLFVRPVLHALGGGLPVRLPTAKARLAREIRTKTGLTRFLPALLRGELLEAEVEIVPWQGSGDTTASSRANCYLVIPPDREFIGAGEVVSILLRCS